MFTSLLLAALSFNPLFTDHAVLQRDRDLTVWGEGAVPGERLELSFGPSVTWTKVNRDGSFRFLLPAQKAGGPYVLKASGEKSGTVEAKDVLVGEVWLCSGQSNMEFLMKSAKPGWEGPADPLLRCYRTPHQFGFGPCAESRSEWRVATPENAKGFTAVGTFFAAALRRELKVPVGILFSAHGGTKVEAWSSRAALEKTECGRRALADFAAKMSDPASWKATDEGVKQLPLDPGPSAEALAWAKDASADGRTVPVPSVFDEIDGRHFNGAVWYRREFTLPADWKGRDLVLTIPSADKHDRTYVNGELVGATGTGYELKYYDAKRVYRVPADLVRGGKALIAIRVWSHVYGGGIVGDPADFTLAPEGAKGLSLDGSWQVKIERDYGRTGLPPAPLVAGNANVPHALFDSKILPLIPYGIRGALWYQGESNEGNAKDYHDFLKAMVEDWRYQWGQGDFPFVAVQLAGFRSPKSFVRNDPWAEIRQAMLDLSRELPAFGVVSAVDVGNAMDIHPTDKLTVGERCAAWVLRGETGPRPHFCRREGSVAIVRFTDVGTGLKAPAEPRGFFLAGKDGDFRAATAKVEGDRVRLTAADVAEPVEVRYAWAMNPGPIDLRNSAGLPASPFRMKVGDTVPVGKTVKTVTVAMREGEHWWGLCNAFGREMPFTAESDFSCDLRADNYGHQALSFLVSDRGRAIWCPEPVGVKIAAGRIELTAEDAEITVDEKAGANLAEAYRAASKRWFPPTGEEPELLYFSAPQYNTWVELTYHQNEKDILAYAQAMLDHGLPPGIFMIDDTWQAGYGDWRFEPTRFADPKGMMDRLHAMGFKVLLWMCPFVSMDSPAFRRLMWAYNPDDYRGWPTKGGLLLDGSGTRHLEQPAAATLGWWNGCSALLDFTHPNGVAWFEEVLSGLVKDYGADGFKFDGGAVSFYTGARAYCRKLVAHDMSVSPAAQSALYGKFALRYRGSEYRNVFGFAGKPVIMRLHDKGHSFPEIRRVVTDLLAAGFVGCPFICPDMVGGGQWTAFLPGAPFSQEVFIRAAQVQALCPMMQLSASPWRYLDKGHQEIFLKAVKLRQKFAPKFVALAKESAKTGEPMMRNLEYVYPNGGYAAVKDEFLMGDDLLVAPQLEEGAASRRVLLPPGRWRDDRGAVHAGPAELTVDTPLDRLPYFTKEER